MNLSRAFHQDVTYWAPAGEDRYGGRAFTAPVVFKARWEDRAEQVISTAGETITSKAVVFVPQQLDADGYLAEGDYAAVSDPALIGALPIAALVEIPDLRNNTKERRAYL